MSVDNQKIVITNAKRTPMGAFQGVFKDFSASTLGSFAIKGILGESKIDPQKIDIVNMGCVLPAGMGQAPARQAALFANLPNGVQACTINKVCGSGLEAIMLSHDRIKLGSAKIAIAGGMESMTVAPYLLPKGRAGYKYGHGSVIDHMVKDGLEDVYSNGQLMGVLAELVSEKYGFSRSDLDNYAINTLTKAQQSSFANEIVPIEVPKVGPVSSDETILKGNKEKIPTLKPAFKPDGTLTAASSSGISDGAAAIMLMTESTAKELSLSPLASIAGFERFSHDPSWYTTAPVYAMKNLMSRLGWDAQSVDAFEINEAFAVVPMAAIKELSIDPAKVNIKGGACALGHPLGASGARVAVTLLHIMQERNLNRGIASLCIGGGEGVAMAFEYYK